MRQFRDAALCREVGKTDLRLLTAGNLLPNVVPVACWRCVRINRMSQFAQSVPNHLTFFEQRLFDVGRFSVSEIELLPRWSKKLGPDDIKPAYAVRDLIVFTVHCSVCGIYLLTAKLELHPLGHGGASAVCFREFKIFYELFDRKKKGSASTTISKPLLNPMYRKRRANRTHDRDHNSCKIEPIARTDPQECGSSNDIRGHYEQASSAADSRLYEPRWPILTQVRSNFTNPPHSPHSPAFPPNSQYARLKT